MTKKEYNRIKEVLVRKKRTNGWLAKELKVSRTTVSRWCTNDSQPSFENLYKIADVLGVHVCELLVDNNPSKN